VYVNQSTAACQGSKTSDLTSHPGFTIVPTRRFYHRQSHGPDTQGSI